MRTSHTPSSKFVASRVDSRADTMAAHNPLERDIAMTSSTQKQLYIGEGFEGPGVNLAHINVLVGPRNGPAGQAFSTAR